MEESAYLTGLIAGSFYLIVSARLFRLSVRTRQSPERMLSAYFAATALYYLIVYSPDYLGLGPLSPIADIAANWIFVLGVFPYLFFIRRVFRPRPAWAGALVWICGFFLLLGATDATLAGGLEQAIDNPWFLVEWLGYAAPAAWMCAEATLCYRSASKRARIGLCDPVIANRYLILAWFGCFQTLACLAGLYWASDIASDGVISWFADALLGSCEIAGVASLWLAFFPPGAYLDWIRAHAVVLPTPMDG